MEPVKDGEAALSPLEIAAPGYWLALVGSYLPDRCERPTAERGRLVALTGAPVRNARALEDAPAAPQDRMERVARARQALQPD